MKVTAEQIKKACKERDITYIPHHQCGICEEWVGYLVDKEQNLSFDSSCGCCASHPCYCSW